MERGLYMEIKKVALIGAGAIGSYFIWGFSKNNDVGFCVVAEGDRAKRLKEEGLVINHAVYRPTIMTSEEAKGADLLLISTKYDALKNIMGDIKKIVTKNTIVMSLLNGIDSEDLIGREIGASHLVYSLMRISAERRNGEVTFNPDITPGVFFGEADTNEKTDRISALIELFSNTEVNYHFTENIVDYQWNKYTLNISYNLPQAVFSVGYGAYYDSDYLDKISRHLENEVRAVAEAYNHNPGDLNRGKNECKPSARFSTLQDLDAKRHTEIEMFLGVLLNLAGQKGIETPYAEYTYYAIKILEQKNEGRFMYD